MAEDEVKEEKGEEPHEEGSEGKKKRSRPAVRYLIIGAVLVTALLIAFAWPRGERYYTDGISVRSIVDTNPLREVVWEEPIPFIAEFEEEPNDFDPELSADGRTVIFARGRPKDNSDLFVSFYDSETKTWSPPMPIEGVNTGDDEMGPELSEDGKLLYFYSDREGGEGGYDLYVAERDGSGWGNAVNLGKGVNSVFDEYDPALTPSGDRIYFASNRPKPKPDEEKTEDDPAWRATLRLGRSSLDFDIFSADRIIGAAEEGEPEPLPTWEPASRVEELNTPADEGQVNFTDRGDFLYFSSNREGGNGRFDIYRARRIHGGLLEPENLGAGVNTEKDEMDPTLWLEGYGLLFTSNRRGETPDDFMVFQTITREVMIEEEGINWNAFWTAFDKVKWWLLLLLAALLGLLWLIMTLIDDEKRQRLGLTQICFLASAAIHLLIAFLLSLWIITQHVMKSNKPMEVNIDSGALAEERMALELREEVNELPNTEPPPVQEPFESLAVPPTPPPQPMDAVTQEFATEPMKLEEIPVEVEVDPTEHVLDAPPEKLTPSAVDTAMASLNLDTPTFNLEAAAPSAAETSPDFTAPKEIVENTPENTFEAKPDTAEMKAGEFQTNDTLPTLDSAPSISVDVPESESTPDMVSNLTPTPFEADLESAEFSAPDFKLDTSREINVASSPDLSPASDTPEFRGEESTEEPQPVASAPENIEADTSADALPGAAEPNELKISESAVGKGKTPMDETTIELPELASVEGMIGTEIPGLELGNPMLLEAPSSIDNPYLLRNPEKRKEVLEQLGGSADTEAAISAALDWFTRNQEDDGRWSMKRHGGDHEHDMAATSLALLCYMGWGATHTREGPYKVPVEKAVNWLVSQAKENGDLRGRGDMYDQGIVTIALAEAYGLTKDERLKPLLEDAAKFIADGQTKIGSWRYNPHDKSGGDTSVYGWQVMALKSCMMAGIDISQECWEKAPEWLDRAGGGDKGGLYGYNNANPKPAMVAEGLFCRQLLGTPFNHPMMEESVNYLKTALPDPGKVNYYYYYYGTLSLYQHKGPVWEEWNERMKKFLVGNQRKGGKDEGSWDPRGEWANQSGRVVITAMATLSLEVYYRYLPMYSGMPGE